jgi:hypothetical protein
MAHQAQDTFVAEIDGAPHTVHKGQVLSDNHPLVKLDGGRGHLFKPLDMDDEEPAPKKRGPGRPRKNAASDSGDSGDSGDGE